MHLKHENKSYTMSTDYLYFLEKHNSNNNVKKNRESDSAEFNDKSSHTKSDSKRRQSASLYY